MGTRRGSKFVGLLGGGFIYRDFWVCGFFIVVYGGVNGIVVIIGF